MPALPVDDGAALIAAAGHGKFVLQRQRAQRRAGGAAGVLDPDALRPAQYAHGAAEVDDGVLHAGTLQLLDHLVRCVALGDPAEVDLNLRRQRDRIALQPDPGAAPRAE